MIQKAVFITVCKDGCERNNKMGLRLFSKKRWGWGEDFLQMNSKTLPEFYSILVRIFDTFRISDVQIRDYILKFSENKIVSKMF